MSRSSESESQDPQLVRTMRQVSALKREVRLHRKYPELGGLPTARETLLRTYLSLDNLWVRQSMEKHPSFAKEDCEKTNIALREAAQLLASYGLLKE